MEAKSFKQQLIDVGIASLLVERLYKRKSFPGEYTFTISDCEFILKPPKHGDNGVPQIIVYCPIGERIREMPFGIRSGQYGRIQLGSEIPLSETHADFLRDLIKEFIEKKKSPL